MSLDLTGYRVIRSNGFWRFVHIEKRLATSGYRKLPTLIMHAGDFRSDESGRTTLIRREYFDRIAPEAYIGKPRRVTATVLIYHVRGTRGTRAVMVTYKGAVLWEHTANASALEMEKIGVAWAISHGCTHTNVIREFKP